MSKPPAVGDDSMFNPHTGLIEPTSDKLKQLLLNESGHVAHAAAKRGCPFMALQTGMAYRDDDNSLKAGTRGPILLEDQVYREKMNHFDHERIPERVVHARGTGAHGYFQVYESLKDITCAQLFQDPKVKTPTFVRFSTVLGSRGSGDTARDVRGFATKFYTEDGNWDLVGNNIPVFFIQDPMKFPDVVHAGKPEQQTEMPQAQTAHDNFWDFCSWSPETMHILCWAMSDRGIPRSYRMMQGFGVHTFIFVNEAGKRTFFKVHWRPLLGVHGLAWDESLKLMGIDPDFHRRDLYEAISAGNFPEYEMGLQLIPEEDEHKFDFDLLDPTKIVPEELVPTRWVGKMTLDRIPTDFFAEVEQVAFCTQNIVRGIDFSNDPLLQGRNFSYLDTQLSRLGSVNFNQIPINRPLHRPLNNQRDGHMQMNIHTDKLNYFPNRNSAKGKAPRPGNGGETQADLAERRVEAFASYEASVEGMKVRAKAPKFLERFDQASLYYNSLTPVEQTHLLKAASFELSKVDDMGVRERMVELWNQVDHELATKLAANIAVAAPGKPTHANHGKASRFLSMVDSPYTPKDSCATRKVACLVGDGYRASEVAALQKALAAEGAMLVMVGSRKGKIYAEGQTVPPVGQRPSGDPAKEQPDPTCKTVNAGFTFDNCKSVLFDGLALVGGPHVAELQGNGNCLAFVSETLKHCKAVCASSEAVQLLLYPAGVAGIGVARDGQNADTVVDDGVITATESKADYVAQFVTALKQHRSWARKGVDKIPA